MKKPRKYTEMNRQNYLFLTIGFGVICLMLLFRTSDLLSDGYFCFIALIPFLCFLYFLISLLICTAYLNKHDDTLEENHSESNSGSLTGPSNTSISSKKDLTSTQKFDDSTQKEIISFYNKQKDPNQENSNLINSINNKATFSEKSNSYNNTNNYNSTPIKTTFINSDLYIYPHEEPSDGYYYKDSTKSALLSLALFIVFFIFDMYYLIKWLVCNEDVTGIFVIRLLLHMVFLAAAVFYFRQRKIKKNTILLNVPRKVKYVNYSRAIKQLIILSVIFFILGRLNEELSRFIHLSRISEYGNSLELFENRATMDIRSNDLNNGFWNPDIINYDGDGISPHLYFEPVKGADHYVIYMTDSTNNSNYGIWLATDIHENELFTGDNLTIHANDPNYRYGGRPLTPPGAKDASITVYVYALKDQPVKDLSPLFSEHSDIWGIGANELYSYYLSMSKDGGEHGFYLMDDRRYGNVISYGYITGKINLQEYDTLSH